MSNFVLMAQSWNGFQDLDYDAEYGARKERDRNPQVNKDGEMELCVVVQIPDNAVNCRMPGL